MRKSLISLLNILAFTQICFSQSFHVTDVSVKKDVALQQLIFSIEVKGIAGDSVPVPIGSLDGAPVLGYVFPTSLPSTAVGFDATDGIVALALTSHPDFDDTPLWDENNDLKYDNDGIVWHPHWVLLESNSSVPGGLAVKATNSSSVLPPTNPGMPMYMDSPGYPVTWDGHKITCTVPLYRMNNQTDFKYDGVTALMHVNTSDPNRPMLGVYEVFSVASGDLSLPYDIGRHSCDTLFMDISLSTGTGDIDPKTIKVFPNPSNSEVHLELNTDLALNQFEVQIHNLGGMKIFNTPLNSTNITIPVSSIGAAGTYFIRVIDINSSEVKDIKKLVLF